MPRRLPKPHPMYPKLNKGKKDGTDITLELSPLSCKLDVSPYDMKYAIAELEEENLVGVNNEGDDIMIVSILLNEEWLHNNTLQILKSYYRH